MSAPTTTTVTSAGAGLFRKVLKSPLAMICIGYLVIVAAIAVFAPIFLPGVDHEVAGNLLQAHQGPSAAHWLGTDTLGRDVLQRLLVGTRFTMVGVVEGMVVALALGIPLGLAAGYFGGRVDRTISWCFDFVFSVPSLILIFVVLSIFKSSLLAAMVTFGILVAPQLGRLVRSATMPVRNEMYIDAARVSGLSRPYILWHHVMPRISGPIIVQASFLAAAILLVQSGLAYLNLIIQSPASSWGGMISDGLQYIATQPWLIWPPGAAIAITMLAFCLLADVVRDLSVEGWQGAGDASRRRADRKAEREQRATPLAAVVPDVSGRGELQPTLLRLQDVTVGYQGDAGPIAIVDRVNLEIREGETVGLVGESGCGKTMAAMSIIGLLTGGARITGGAVWFQGKNLVGMSDHDLGRIRGKEVGLISQEPMVGFNPTFTVGAQLEHLLRIHHGINRRNARVRAIDLLRRVHLPDPELVARRYPHQLSGGMAQRVAIARALTGDPKLLIADEPTTALDVTVQAEILALLRELARDQHMAILLVSHDWGVVADICDRAVVMYAGQVVERASISEIFETPLHPYTSALLASNPHHATRGQLLPTISGSVPRPGTWPTGCRFQARCAFATDACGQGPIAMTDPVPGRDTRCIHPEALASITQETM